MAKSSEATEKNAKTAAVKIRCPLDRFGRYATNARSQVMVPTQIFPRLHAPMTPKSIAPMFAVATVLKIKSGNAIEPIKNPMPFKSPSSGRMRRKRTENNPVKMASIVTRRALNRRNVGLDWLESSMVAKRSKLLGYSMLCLARGPMVFHASMYLVISSSFHPLQFCYVLHLYPTWSYGTYWYIIYDYFTICDTVFGGNAWRGMFKARDAGQLWTLEAQTAKHGLHGLHGPENTWEMWRKMFRLGIYWRFIGVWRYQESSSLDLFQSSARVLFLNDSCLFSISLKKNYTGIDPR